MMTAHERPSELRTYNSPIIGVTGGISNEILNARKIALYKVQYEVGVLVAFKKRVQKVQQC